MAARKPRRERVVTVTYTRHSAFFHGVLQRDLMPAIRDAGVAWQWSHSRNAMGVSAATAGEVEARLVSAGFTVNQGHQGVLL